MLPGKFSWKELCAQEGSHGRNWRVKTLPDRKPRARRMHPCGSRENCDEEGEYENPEDTAIPTALAPGGDGGHDESVRCVKGLAA